MTWFIFAFIFGSIHTNAADIDSKVIIRPRIDEIIWETMELPEFLDPHVDYERSGAWLFYNVYETLYTYQWDSSSSDHYVPLLAAGNPLVSADGLNYTIGLRAGIKFHDGTPFNASCVKWNIERAMKIGCPWGPVWMIGEPLKGGKAVVDAAIDDNGEGSPAFTAVFDDWLATSAAINVIDDYIIQFVLEKPYPAFQSVLANPVGSMMSPSYAIAHASDPVLATWENYGVDYAEWYNPMIEWMCGTGPYQLGVWALYDYIKLDINQEYWRDPIVPQSGSIRSVLIRMNEDTTSRHENLRNGLIDGCYWPKTEADDIWNPEIENSTHPDIHVSTFGLGFELIFAGFNVGTILVNDIEYPSPFSNLHFRRAVAYAFRRQDFIEEELMRFGVPGKGPIPIGMFGHNESAFILAHNLTLAVEEWNQAMTDPNFVDVLNLLENEIELTTVISSHEPSMFYDLMMLALLEIWGHPLVNQTGLDKPMECVVVGLDWGTYITALEQRQLLVYLMGWTPDFADSDNYLFPTVFHNGVFAWRIGYNNTDVNMLYEQQRGTSDYGDRRQLLNLIQETVAQDMPYLWLAQEIEFRVWRRWLTGPGLVFNPMHDIYFYDVYKTEYTNPTYSDPLRFYLIIGICIEVVIIAILIVYRYSKRAR